LKVFPLETVYIAFFVQPSVLGCWHLLLLPISTLHSGCSNAYKNEESVLVITVFTPQPQMQHRRYILFIHRSQRRRSLDN